MLIQVRGRPISIRGPIGFKYGEVQFQIIGLFIRCDKTQSAQYAWSVQNHKKTIVRRLYNAIIFHPNRHKRHLITHRWGRDMGCLNVGPRYNNNRLYYFFLIARFFFGVDSICDIQDNKYEFIDIKIFAYTLQHENSSSWGNVNYAFSYYYMYV